MNRFVLHALVPIVAGAVVLATAGPAQAQIIVTNLHPAGASSSGASGIFAGQQVGGATFDGVNHASLWTGTAGSWLDLTPAGVVEGSGAVGVYNGQQVGSAEISSASHASLWNGTAGSWVDIHPSGAIESVGRATSGGQQVGWVIFGGFQASLWSGTASSWVNLHPAGAAASQAFAVQGGQQAGFVWVNSQVSTNRRASLWTGTAASWVNLQPANAIFSVANGVNNGQQVGYATFGVGLGDRHAGLWNGTAASWVDLNPAGVTDSIANAVFNGVQVGQATVGGIARASLWNGTAASWVDLSLSLPGSWSSSNALGVWSDAAAIYVVGSGFNNDTGRTEALLWTVAVPEPGSVLLMAVGAAVVGMGCYRRMRQSCQKEAQWIEP